MAIHKILALMSPAQVLVSQAPVSPASGEAVYIPLMEVCICRYMYLHWYTYWDSVISTCRPSIAPDIGTRTGSISTPLWFAVSGVLGALLLLSGIINIVVISILIRKRRKLRYVIFNLDLFAMKCLQT